VLVPANGSVSLAKTAPAPSSEIDRHTRDDGHRLCKQLDPVRRNRIVFRVADGLDSLLSGVKPRLFCCCPRHFTLDGLFDLEISYPAIEPPAHLVALHPEVYQQEQARVRERFESAVELAEQAFATELGEEFPPKCPACGGDIRLIAFITEPGPIRKILTHLGEPLEPPPLSPARGPPTDWGELVQADDDRAIFQASPDELPVIDIYSL